MQTVQAMKVELKKEIMTVVEESESKLKDKLQTNDSHWQEIEERVKELQSSVNVSLNKKMSQLVSVESLQEKLAQMKKTQAEDIKKQISQNCVSLQQFNNEVSDLK